MARFLVKASEFKNVCKAVNDRQLESLKKEIIEILKKQDEKEFKKAINLFESQEMHYTHLEKSLISGKWIQKAGYGVGTVRIWKGKKYKKIAPGKWARVFEKEGRGTNIAIGKLIAKVQKIDNVEDLMAFVMANKQRFVDENGIDLPVLDKLRAAVDARNGNVGSKEIKDAKAELKRNPYSIREMSRTLNFNELIPEYEKQKKILNWDINKKKKEIEKKYDFSDFSEEEKNKFLEPKFIDLENQYQAASDNIEYIKNELKRAMERDGVNDVIEKMKKHGIFDEVMGTSKPAEKKTDGNDYLEGNWGDPENDIPFFLKKEHVKDLKDRKDTFETKDGQKYSILNRNGNKYQIERTALNGDKKVFLVETMGYGKGFHVTKLEEESEAEKKSKTEEDKGLQKEEKNERIDSVDNSDKVVSFDELKPIATNKSVGENEAQLPYSKELADEIESLKNCVAPKRDSRDFMKHVYYEDGKLVSTDARRMKFIEVGDLEGIPDGSYVDINTDKSGINIKKINLDYRFPNYKKVISENLNQSATLDTKLVKDKIKEMQKDGAISKKGNNLIQLEFRDGKVFIDDTPVGEAKDIKMKYGENWGPANKETNFMAINADYLVNALSGKKSVLQIGERADKAIAINTGSTSNILMPMSGSDKKMDYGQGRQAKKENDEYKANAKQKAQDALNSIVDTQKDSMNNELVQSLINKVNNKEMENHKTIIEHAYKALKDAEKMIEKPTKKWTSSLANNKYGYSLLAAVRINPEFKTALENMAMEYGLIKKSLFDDFIVDVFEADDEEEIEDELYEGETEYNDYSAVQPELFNSTAMKVREAFDRMNC